MAATCAALVASLSACSGSALSPAEVRAANEGIYGSSTGNNNSTGGTGGGSSTSAGNPAGGLPSGSPSAGGSAANGPAGSGAGGTNAAGAGSTGGAAAAAGVAAGSCAGFHNGPGITDTTITIGNASDISGPIPGLFSAAQQGVKAYVAYFNATSKICGRKLAFVTQDTQTSGSGDQIAYTNLCQSSFAAVGSMSAFDSGGAQTAQSCGIPDIRTAITTDARAACSTCYASQGSNAAYYENAPFTYFFRKFPSVKNHVAVAYLDAAGAVENAKTIQSVLHKLGSANVDMEAIGASDLSYDSYVQSMKSKGVQYVFFLGPYQDTVKLQQSFKTNGFTPKVFVQDPTIYDPSYVSQAAGAGVGNGTYVYMNFLPFELASTNREESTYLSWLQQVAPGSHPTFYGAFAWSAAALFVREALQLGGKLTRASLVQALSTVHVWTDNGMTAPQNVGAKINAPCYRFIQLQNSHWNSLGGYECDGITHR